MRPTLPTLDELRRHPVAQCLANQHLAAHGAGRFDSATHTAAPPRLWVACSGGRDSLSLAYAAWLLGLPVSLIHVNHNLQTQAYDWQLLVVRFARNLGMNAVVAAIQLDKKNEASARAARYAVFAKHLGDHDVLMLAHHQDDQAETILLNLMRGAGLTGLSGMQQWQRKQLGASSLTLWRPWLEVSRTQITDFAAAANLAFADDPTNVSGSSTANARAYLRAEILPKLQHRFGNIAAPIARSGSIIAEADVLLTSQRTQDMHAVLEQDDVLNLAALLQLPKARQLRVLAAFLQHNSCYAPSRELTETLQSMCTSSKTDQKAQLVFGVGEHARQYRRYAGRLYRLPLNIAAAQNQEISLHSGGKLTLPSGCWQVKPCGENEVGLPLHLLGKVLHLKPKCAGERLHIAGRAGSWPLKKFFQDIKLAPWLRPQAHIMCDSGGMPLALVCGAGFFVVANVATDSGWVLTTENTQA